MSLEGIKELEVNGRYNEAIQMGLNMLNYDEGNFAIYVHIIYCNNALGNYRAALVACDYAVNRCNDGRTPQDRERDISGFRNLALNMLRGIPPGDTQNKKSRPGYRSGQANAGDLCSYCFHARTDHQGGAGACSGRGGPYTGFQDYCVCGRFTLR